MIELLIIADDLTGALDTGVQFAKKDIATKVVVGTDCDFSDDISVLVVDAETRHLSPERAGETVKRVVKDAVSHGVERFYKKQILLCEGISEANWKRYYRKRENGLYISRPPFPRPIGSRKTESTMWGGSLYLTVSLGKIPLSQ